MVKEIKKIFYWSPCLTNVGTVISTKNSAIALSLYSKSNYEVTVINACGEWDSYITELRSNGVSVLNLTMSYFKYLPKEGYLSSRISYLIIFLISFFPLLFCLKLRKPDFLIAHLITSLPLSLLNLFKFKTRFVLRISGLPKLNLFRRYFWFLTGKEIYKITCPTIELKNKLIENKIFDKNKLFYLPDAILNLKNYKKIENKLNIIANSDKKIILSAGRLTKQKNFGYLINEFSKFCEKNDNYDLVILGDGEQKNYLEGLINRKKIKEKIHLIGRVSNVYDYMRYSDVFVLSSLWEELGFVIVEAAFNNLFIISSNCPNGPKEFIDDNKCGILFKNNEDNSLKNALVNYINLNNNQKKLVKINAKVKSKHYIKFRHYLLLLKVLN